VAFRTENFGPEINDNYFSLFRCVFTAYFRSPSPLHGKATNELGRIWKEAVGGLSDGLLAEIETCTVRLGYTKPLGLDVVWRRDVHL
jgi:hypothetical protein